MPICEMCGKSFDLEEAEESFESDNWLLSYSNIKRCLCGECATNTIEDQADGVYYETCERCGKTFDLITAEGFFSSHFPWYNGTDLRDYWDKKQLILCAECAINDAENDED